MKIIFTLILFLSTIFAQTTLCYKNNTLESSIDKDVLLDGGECLSSYSKKDMLRDGWKLTSYNSIKKNDTYNHIFVFSKEDSSTQRTLPKLYYKKTYTKIHDTTENTTKINLAYLKVGQSGAIVQKVGNNYLIVSSAVVTDSNKEGSTLEFIDIDLLRQEALPTSNLKPQNGDTFVLNHLYNTSLLIVPNTKAKKMVLENYKKQNFLSEDFFASYLKVHNTPIPLQEDITNFCKKQQIGTIYLVIKNKLYILDALSFSIIDTIDVAVNSSITQMPFLTKIEEIEEGILGGDFGLSTVVELASKINLYDPDYNPNATNVTSDKQNVETIDKDAKFEDYNKHYLNMIGKL